MADHDFRCGDILRCASKYYAEQLGIVGEHGIVMGTKPHHIHLWFEAKKRSYWLVYDMLRSVTDAELSPLIKRIQLIAYQLDAEEWELEETPELHRLLCYLDHVTIETLNELKTNLDVDYHSLSLSPEGMGRMIAHIEWTK
jgi:hypothetical protein